MKNTITFLGGFLLLFLLFGCKESTEKKETDPSQEETAKIVSLNGSITEILVALGLEEQLVGRDVTSTYPPSLVETVPDLGHVRSLTIEPLINLHPTMILGMDSELSEDLKNALDNSGIEFKLYEPEASVKSTYQLIDQLAEKFDASEKAEEIKAKIANTLDGLEEFTEKPKVLFIYARGAGTLMVSGKNTPIAEMIQIAGGQNAVNDFEDYKPLTEEALLAHNPDVILLFDSGMASLGGKDGLLKAVPALGQTQAGKNAAIITMDGGLLSAFGPRLGQAATELHHLISPYAN